MRHLGHFRNHFMTVQADFQPPKHEREKERDSGKYSFFGCATLYFLHNID